MSGSEYLLDTNIILYVLSGNKMIADYLHQKKLYTSVICEMELLGFKNLSIVEEKGIKAFLSQFRIIYIDDVIRNETILLRKTYGLKLPDCIVGATAISLNLPLISSDKAFKQVKNLLLELYEP